MKLNSFQIKNYKIIDDTGVVRVDPNLTALVGKNESGKTAVLKALWKSRNGADARFDKLYDFPRDRYPKERTGSQVVTVLEFALSDREAASLAELLPGRGGQPPTKVTRITRYVGPNATESEIIFEASVAETLTGRDAATAIEALSRVLATQDSVDAGSIRHAALSAVQGIDAALPLWTERNVSALESFSEAVANWLIVDQLRQGEATAERTAFETLVATAKQGDPTLQARAWAEENLPTFIYYDDYARLETLIHLPSFLARRSKPDPRTRAQSALFEWAGLDPAEILALGSPRGEDETE